MEEPGAAWGDEGAEPAEGGGASNSSSLPVWEGDGKDESIAESQSKFWPERRIDLATVSTTREVHHNRAPTLCTLPTLSNIRISMGDHRS